MAGDKMKAAPFLVILSLAGGLACGLPALAALDGAGPPGLGSIEQFPIIPRAAPPGEPFPAQPSAPPPQTGNPLWAVPLRNLSATRERPIFSPSRRPPPAAVVVAPPPPAPPVVAPPVPERPVLALIGTIVGEGESIAIFYNTATRATIRLRLGETDDMGWKLVAVDARTSLLEKGKQSVTLALPAPGDPPVPGAFGLPQRSMQSDL
ncbi:MAG: general secretion pathway protein GspN [Methylobacteriaceae bacterium]|nr:general secretion pathway protein GspN [Methylobacteriaceae bacterium]